MRYLKKFNENFLFEHKLHKNQYQLLDYIKKLSDKNFVFIDTETTGLGGYKKQQLTQISAISYSYNFIKNEFVEKNIFNKKIKISNDMKNRLYDPNDDIRTKFKFNKYGNKITDDPKYYDEIEVINEFINWLSNLGDSILILQNASFDMNMIVGRSKFFKSNKYEILDTKQIIQLFIIPIVKKISETKIEYQKKLDDIGFSERDNGLTSSSMSKWAPFFNINMNGYHDALTDCRITSEMFIKMIEFIKMYSYLNISKYQVERIIK